MSAGLVVALFRLVTVSRCGAVKALPLTVSCYTRYHHHSRVPAYTVDRGSHTSPGSIVGQLVVPDGK